MSTDKSTLMTREGLLLEAKKIGLNQEDVLKAAMSLYYNGYITNPQSDVGSLPASCQENVLTILASIRFNSDKIDTSLQINPSSLVFVNNADSPDYEYHGIVPALNSYLWRANVAEVGPLASEVYEMVARAYVGAVCY
jgi:DNA topoisomerase IA